MHSSFLEVIILFWSKFPSSLKRPRIITLSVTTNKKAFSILKAAKPHCHFPDLRNIQSSL